MNFHSYYGTVQNYQCTTCLSSTRCFPWELSSTDAHTEPIHYVTFYLFYRYIQTFETHLDQGYCTLILSF